MRHNKLWKKAMALTCAAACAATTLAGCGSSTQAEKPSEKTEAQGESGAAEGQTEITFTVWDYETTDYWKKLVEAFEAENPDIKVKVMDIGATDYDTKIPVLLSSGDTSDVITIKSMNIYNSLVEKNQLMPLDDKVKESGVDMAPYQGSDEGIRIDDKKMNEEAKKLLSCTAFHSVMTTICCITTRLCSIRRVLSIQRTI